MVGIKIAGEFLDLAPNTEIEGEQNNPFLQFTDELAGQFTYPFEVDASPKNLRLLAYSGLMQKRITNIGIDAEMWDGGIQVSIGKIKIEKPNLNLNRTSDGKISCYYVTGSSSFYQDIKDKKLKDINVGGDRSFDWDGTVENTSGFWSHLYDVLNAANPGYGDSGYDYAFYPVKNMAWPGSDYDINIMNSVYLDTGTVHMLEYFDQGGKKDLNRVVPFPYLKYVLLQAVAFAGWQITGDILDDADFKKITLINFQAINWAFIKRMGAGVQVIVAVDPVIFNLQDCLPDVTIGDFLLQLKNRMGWYYDFDSVNKIIRIKALKDVVNSGLKDFTAYANPAIQKTINQEEKIYALRNSFNPDMSGGAPAFDKVELVGSVDELTDLPVAGESYYDKVYRVTAENNFYIAANADDGSWSWALYAYNIYDYAPSNSNEEINTSATTVGNEPYDAYMDFVPRIDLQGNWFGRTDIDSDWGIILCFYHGLRNNKVAEPYPYGSSGIYDSTFAQVAQWSLAFECFKADGTDVGLYALEWKPILDLLKSAEEFDLTLNLPVHLYLQLKFGDRLVIAGVKMWIKQMKPKIPYKKSMEISAVRIL